MNLPRLFVNGHFSRFVQPISVSINLTTTPLSTASIVLPAGEELPARGWVEMFTPYGSAGMFRVRSPHDAYGEETTTAELEHMISEVGDYIVKEEISEMMSATAAMQRVFKHYQGGKWKLGNVSQALGTGTIALQVNYGRVLDAMLSILEQKKDCMLDFDFSTTPWIVRVVKKGTTVAAEGRLARNVTSATISSDDTEMCTRCWYQTFDKDGNGTWKYKDADTKTTYGIIERTVRTSSDMTSAEINATVDAFIECHKNPRISVAIQGLELARITGESLDKMVCGKLYRLALPDYGMTVEKNIDSISWQDVYGNPDQMTVNLGEEEDTVVTFLHNLDSKGHGGGGGGRARDAQDEANSLFRTDFYRDNQKIQLIATKTNEAGEILRQAGMKLNSKGVLIYATDNENSIGAKIKVQSDKIKLVVTEDGKINSSKIMSAISMDKSGIKLRADQIVLDGKTIANILDGQKILCDYINSNNAVFGPVKATNVSTGDIQVNGTLKVGSYNTSWKSFNNRYVALSMEHSFNYGESGSVSGRVVTGYTDTTIYYLGR